MNKINYEKIYSYSNGFIDGSLWYDIWSWFKYVAEAATEQRIGNSDYGIMYIYPDTVEAVKKDGRYYVVVSAERPLY